MDAPFRNDVDALEARLASLDEELADLRGKAREYESVRERLSQLEGESAEVRREIDARTVRRATPLLDTLRIASPCDEPWDDMVGDERRRFCGKCEKDVHNVSGMTRVEAEALLQSVAGSICVRMYQRLDGTVLTADCPVGVRRRRVKRLFLRTVGGGLVAAAGALAFWRYEESVVLEEMPVEASLGEPAAPAPTSPVQGGAEVEPVPTSRPVLTGKPVMVTAGIAPLSDRPHPANPLKGSSIRKLGR